MIDHYGNNQLTNDYKFWMKVPRGKSRKDCWIWRGTVTKGRATFASQTAAKVMWNKTFTRKSGDLCVCHHCDNPKCVNPFHLFLGTHLDNMNDMIRKGRHVPLKGSKNGNRKLTEDIVILIRKIRHTEGSSVDDLAKRFKVSESSIRKIIYRESWKHI